MTSCASPRFCDPAIFFFSHPATTAIYTLSLHDALPIFAGPSAGSRASTASRIGRSCGRSWTRSEEHTSELHSRFDLVCRLLLEKKKKIGKAPIASPSQNGTAQPPPRQRTPQTTSTPLDL